MTFEIGGDLEDAGTISYIVDSMGKTSVKQYIPVVHLTRLIIGYASKVIAVHGIELSLNKWWFVNCFFISFKRLISKRNI